LIPEGITPRSLTVAALMQAGILMYYRVFASNYVSINPAALLEHMHGLDFEVTGHFKGDAQGWFRAELIYPEADARLELERFLANEEGIRSQLNTWAAWLETACPDQPRWLQHLIGATQVFTLQCLSEEAEEEKVDLFCLELCRFLATATAGIMQVDGQGFFTETGVLIVKE
jgi:hypothetical protein